MALKKDIQTEYGNIAGSYIKIQCVKWTSEFTFIDVNFYLSEAARFSGSPPIQVEHYGFVPDINASDNYTKQAYSYLKTLEKFQGAMDI